MLCWVLGTLRNKTQSLCFLGRNESKQDHGVRSTVEAGVGLGEGDGETKRVKRKVPTMRIEVPPSIA